MCPGISIKQQRNREVQTLLLWIRARLAVVDGAFAATVAVEPVAAAVAATVAIAVTAVRAATSVVLVCTRILPSGDRPAKPALASC
jgi:hypothetical protein